jgi:serine protease AprX
MKLIGIGLLAALCAGAGDLSGVWTGTLKMEPKTGAARPPMPVWMQLEQDGSRITGAVGPREQDSAAIRTGSVESGRIAIEVGLPKQQTLRLQLTRTGDDALSGTFAGEGMGDFQGKIELRRGSAPAPQMPVESAGLKPFDDVRFIPAISKRKEVRGLDLSGFDALATLTFNQKTVWPEAARMPKGPSPADLIEFAKDPGLGVRQLHRDGITGKGVAVAIIDQPLYAEHPEFAGKLAGYENFGERSPSSMHGPAVLSLLAGRTTGTAPDAKVYFAVAASWLKDARLFAQALDWIVEQNRKAPPAGKVRVVSVSAAPTIFQHREAWEAAVGRAETEGILVLDCTNEHGLISSCWLRGRDREDPASYTPGYPGMPGQALKPHQLLVPTSPRTVAEQYLPGQFGYTYCGRGGLSWAIPYAAGVLALGWQVRPELSGKEMFALLHRSAFQGDGQARIIHPGAFAKAVREFRR